MKKALVYLILCCTALPAGAQTLTLDECRAAAAEHNRTLRDGRFELEAALQTRREALTGYFPQVSATGGVFQAQHGLVQADFGMTIPQLGTMNLPLSMVKRGIVGGITAVQPVFAGLKIVNGNKLARLGEEVGRLQLQKTESEVREQTDAYYWQVVSLRDNLSTIEAVERQLEEIHRQVELSVKAGLVTTNDLLRVELRQQEIASNRLKVENGLKVSKMLLAQHIGVDWRAFDVAAAEFGQPEAPAAFYVPVEEALDNRAEYRLQRDGQGCGRRAGFRPGVGPHLRLVGRGARPEEGPHPGAAGRERSVAGPRDAGRGDRADVERGAGILCADSADAAFRDVGRREPAAEPQFLPGRNGSAHRPAGRRDALHPEPQRLHLGMRRLPDFVGALHARDGAIAAVSRKNGRPEPTGRPFFHSFRGGFGSNMLNSSPPMTAPHSVLLSGEEVIGHVPSAHPTKYQ